MDKLPPELIKQPRPLVYLIGNVDLEPDIHDRLISCLQDCRHDDSKEAVGLDFRSVPLDYKFSPKKPHQDAPSIDGILKVNWMKKHSQNIPSVVLMLTSFNVEWSATEWGKRETLIVEFSSKLRGLMSPRDVKIVLIVYKSGYGMLEKETFDERISALKHKCHAEGKNFVFLGGTDMQPSSTIISKLYKTVREYSTSYYIAQAKRLKQFERMLRPNEVILIARYNFKVGFFYEFQGQTQRALRSYRQAYTSLLDLKETADDEFLDQVKAIAEMTNYKICNIYLKGGSAKEAAEQHRTHTESYKSAFTSRSWKHYGWMADQYVIYAQLLTVHSINSSFTDADRSFYYHNAALYSSKRQRSFRSVKSKISESVEDYVNKKFPGSKISQPKYIGCLSRLFDTNSGQYVENSEEIRKLMKQLVIESEKKVDYPKLILELLKKALDNINPLHRRRRAHLKIQISKQYVSMGDYDLASSSLNTAVELFTKERWPVCAIPMLQKKMACAVYQGHPREYLVAALSLYATDANTVLTKHDKEQLHKDIVAVIQNTERPSDKRKQALGNDLPLPLRPEYGAAATPSSPAEYILPDGYIIDLTENISLFKVKFDFAKSQIEVGQTVPVSLQMTSYFYDELKFSEMWTHFSEDVIVQQFVDSSFVNGENGAIICDLNFSPKVTKQFNFELYIPEMAVFNALEAHICLEKIKLIIRIPNPDHLSEFDLMQIEELSLPPNVEEINSSLTEIDTGELSVDDLTSSLYEQPINEEIPASTADIDISLDDVTSELINSSAEYIDNETLESVDGNGESESYLNHDTEVDLNLTDLNLNEKKNEVESTFMDPLNQNDNYLSETIKSISGNDSQLHLEMDIEVGEVDESSVERLQSTPSKTTSDSFTDGVENSATFPAQQINNEIGIIVPNDAEAWNEGRASSPNLSTDIGGNVASFSANSELVDNKGFNKEIENSYVQLNNDASVSEMKLSTSPPSRVRSESNNSAPRDRRPSVSLRVKGYREVIVQVSALTKAFRESRVGAAKAILLSEMSKFLGSEGPKTLIITPPRPKLKLLDPIEPITILQGTIQRVNFILYTDEDFIFQGKVYVSSNYNPPPNGNHDFFWYPDIKEYNVEGAENANYIDSVRFHPFALNSSFQPADSLQLPNIVPNTIFAVPLFIKSDSQGQITMRINVEYVSKSDLTTPIFIEFSCQLIAVKPYGMNFNISSLNDPHCGVEKKHGQSTVLRGDIITVQASLDCVNSLGKNLEVMSMTITPKSTSINVFDFLRGPQSADLLCNSVNNLPSFSSMTNSYIKGGENEESKYILLKKGEAFVGSVDLKCLNRIPTEAPLPFGQVYKSGLTSPLDVVEASMGDVMVHWRIEDSMLMMPIRFEKYYKQLKLEMSENVKNDAWLLPFVRTEFTDNNTKSSSSINTVITRSRICSMMFSVPPVKVIDPPFIVEIHSPSIGHLGFPFLLKISIRSKLHTVEKLILQSDLCEDFVISGLNYQVVEISPKETVETEFILAPLECGQVPLPHVKATWERTKITVLEFGTFYHPRHIFVKPTSASVSQ